MKTVQEFIEFHKLTNIDIIEVQKWGMESFYINTLSVVSQKIIFSEAFVITDDIIGNIFVRNRNKKSIAKHLDLLLSLKPWDLVVHREHGIAIFYAITKKNTGNLEREYAELHYAEWDKLFVPLTELYRVSKYLGKPDVELTKLSGKEWERTMEKTTEEIEAIAMDILETNARRSLAKGRSFAKFRDKEIEFQDAFAHEYTHDQSNAINEIFEDMESEVAMDRLISGDVGFGKTEVAMNAIYKAVLSGTQVAVISPLLVLADEHYETFIDRLTPFGVRIGIMTRMNSAREITQTLEELKNGNIDVVVGTHRLLSEDVRYKKLGLLVIDEEHKFGVTHKERIKKIRAGIDILALSATPIPRSLNLALSGLKKISIIATPPKKKKPIETIITRWDESVIAHAIRYEIDRWGQVIILHNRIKGMESLAREIEEIVKIAQSGKLQVKSSDNSLTVQKLENSKWRIRKEGSVWFISSSVCEFWESISEDFRKKSQTVWAKAYPKGISNATESQRGSFWNLENWTGIRFQNEAEEVKTFGTFSHKSTEEFWKNNNPKIIITHGQMPGDQIEDRIHAFKKWEYNILLSTTIIENGVNFLRANTIIIVDPEEFGLASLHQLRGRVGRRDADAYCYLMYRKPELAKDEKERLITIANNTHLGAGFEIAMRDMEIRWAWDVLGIKQSGRSKDIGLTLYFRLLEERIAELRDEKKKRIMTKIELDISYILREEYFLSEWDKLNFFREIENLESLEELEEMEKEVQSWKWKVESSTSNQEDLIWEISSFSNLFLLVRSRLILSDYNVIKLSKIGLNYVFDLSDSSTVADTKRFLERFDTQNRMILLSAKKIRIETKYWKTISDFLVDITIS